MKQLLESTEFLDGSADHQRPGRSDGEHRPLQTEVNQRFRILNELGRGGMAVVFLAEDIQTHQRIALKMMKRSLSGTAKQRFTREFSTIVSLKHPYLIDVFEYGESDEGPYFAMELFDSKQATTLIGESLEVIFKALFQLCEAIEFIHSKRILHRDIKPGNVLVRRKGTSGEFEIRLSDFGLAKFANTSSSLSGDTNFVGTLAYCSPEQILREDLDYRTDLYSLGLLCHHIITGRHPFADAKGNLQSLISMQLSEVPIDLRSARQDVPASVAQEVFQLLAKDPNDRPGSTMGLRSAFASFLGWTDSLKTSEDHSSPSILTTRFVGRSEELASVEDIIGNALKPVPQGTRFETPPVTSVLITGDAGMGKSSLMRRGARKALVLGAKVFEGRCFEGNATPFQPFVEIIRQIISELERVRRRTEQGAVRDAYASTAMLHGVDSSTAVDGIVQEYAAELVRLGPDLQILLGKRTPSRIAEVQRDTSYVFRAIANFFVSLARIQPICLLIEDIQWADRSSIDLYRHLIAETQFAFSHLDEQQQTPRLVICTTARSEQQYAESNQLIAAFVESPLARQVALSPFDDDSIPQLIASILHASSDSISPQLTQIVRSNCFGNTFHMIETIKELRDQNQIRFDGEMWEPIGEFSDGQVNLTSIRAAVEKRLALLSEHANLLISNAAVIGTIVNLDLLRSATPESSDYQFYSAVDELLARGVFREVPQAQRLQFVHDLFREAALKRISNARRSHIHRTVAGILEEHFSQGLKVDRATMAHHHLSGGSPSKAYPHFFDAAMQAVETQAYEDAAKILLVANENRPDDLSREQQYELELLMGKTLANTSAYSESVQHFERALSSSDTRLQRSEVYLGIAQGHLEFCSNRESVRQFERGLEELGELPPKFLPRKLLSANFNLNLALFAPRALAGLFRKSPEEHQCITKLFSEIGLLYLDCNIPSFVWCGARRAWTSQSSRDPELIALAYEKLAVNLAASGPCAPFARIAERISRAHGEQVTSPYSRAHLLLHRGCVQYLTGHLRAGRDLITQSQKVLKRTRDHYNIIATHMRRHIATLDGDAQEIAAISKEELEDAMKINNRTAAGWAKYGLGNAFSRMGKFDEAIELAHEGERMTRDGHCNSVAHAELAFVLIQASRYEEAYQFADLGCKKLVKDWYINDWAVPNFTLRVEAMAGPLWHTGPTAFTSDQLRSLRRALRLARMIGLSFVNLNAHWWRVAGRAAAANGRPSRAIKRFNRAIVAAKRYENRWEEARAYLDLSYLLDGVARQQAHEKGSTLLAQLKSVIPEAERETRFPS